VTSCNRAGHGHYLEDAGIADLEAKGRELGITEEELDALAVEWPAHRVWNSRKDPRRAAAIDRRKAAAA
jgi:hypothetical protein